MIERTKCEAWYIVAIRSPAAVAESCRRAWNFSDELSHALWVQFTVGSLLSAAAGHPTIAVDYDQFMLDPSACLYRIADWLNISVTSNIRAAVENFATDFIRRDLQHFVGSSDAASPALPQQLYSVLQKAAVAEKPLNGDEFQVQWQTFIPQIAAFTHDLDALDRERRKIFAKRLYWRSRTAIRDMIARVKTRSAGWIN